LPPDRRPHPPRGSLGFGAILQQDQGWLCRPKGISLSTTS
jgi:hypothetical protein